MKLTEVAQTELEKLLNKYGIQNYTIREDGLVDVDGDVDLSRKLFSELPVKFGRVTGYFGVQYCKNLKSLKGVPTEVGGIFTCSGCIKLTSLEGAPTSVGGYFSCSTNANLISLEGAPTSVGGYFSCSSCINLKSLKGAPQEVGGDFICSGCTKLTSLEGAPTKVGEALNCHICLNLTSLKGLPAQIDGKLILTSCPKILNILVIFNTKGITEIEHNNKQLVNILNKYLPTRDMLNCQDELIEAGLEKYAEVE